MNGMPPVDRGKMDQVWTGVCKRQHDQREHFAIILQKLVEVWGQPIDSVADFRDRIERDVLAPAKAILDMRCSSFPTSEKTALMEKGTLNFETLEAVERAINETPLVVTLNGLRPGSSNRAEVAVLKAIPSWTRDEPPAKKTKGGSSTSRGPPPIKSLVVVAENLSFIDPTTKEMGPAMIGLPVNAVFGIGLKDNVPTLIRSENGKKVCVIYGFSKHDEPVFARGRGCKASLLRDHPTALEYFFVDKCDFQLEEIPKPNGHILGLDPALTHLVGGGLDAFVFGSGGTESDHLPWAGLDSLKLDDDPSNALTVADLFAGYFQKGP